MRTMTFSEFIATGYEYPEIITEDLQQTIFDWFQFRHICDDEKFGVFFTRLLEKDFEQYNQLLRIEPGIAQYDWLVSSYKELQREDLDSRTVTINGESTESGSDSNTETRNLEDETTYNTQVSGTSSRDNDATRTVQETIARDDTVTSSKTDITDTDTTDQLSSNSKNATRSLPMSTAALGVDQQTGDLASLDWSTASAQSETSGKENRTGTVDTEVTSTGTDTLDSDTTRSVTEINDGGYSDTEQTNKTGTDTTERTGTITNARTLSNSKTNESATSSAGTGRTRVVETGRNNQIALMLDNASKFIKKSSAWQWLADQLETVFIGVYDI